MKSVGGFTKREINGNPFLIFTSSLQTDNSSSSSGSGDEPHFPCPLLRLEAEELKQKETGDSTDKQIIPFTTPPHFQTTENVSGHHEVYLFDSYDSFVCEEVEGPSRWFLITKFESLKPGGRDCRICGEREKDGGCYYCDTCDEYFHKECVEAPLEIKVHPTYPFLSLQLCSRRRNRNRSSSHNNICVICKYHLMSPTVLYYCPIYDISMHPFCALKPIPTVINHSKRHLHPLILFPKQASLACDVCGMVQEFIPTYVCSHCIFVVHHDCIYFPYVIKISRHQHRVSFTYSLPSGKLSCGVCRKKVDNSCGAYSCNQCDGYFVHSRCALREDLWDGIELEGVPEEPEVIVEPFVTIAEGIILHFSHGHHLKLEVSKVYDDTSCCRGCILPIYEGNYYSCVLEHCGYILHEACANAPLKKHNPLHALSLDLKVETGCGYFTCDACQRNSCGFFYDSPQEGLFRLDLRCASISEPFQYEDHKHPLYLALTPKEEQSQTCHICMGDGADADYLSRKLSCIECDFIICFRCATLPYKAKYKHDKHFLTFRRTEFVRDKLDWCEACEEKINYPYSGFYACDDYCGTTLHIDCLLGKDLYAKPDQTITSKEIRIVRNNTMSRPFCHGRYCRGKRKRCSSKVYFVDGDLTYCSFDCVLIFHV